jgi:hypothetical protein
MLTHHRSVSLSFISTNLAILSHIDTVATLYQREPHKFHLVLNPSDSLNSEEEKRNKSLLWLEISPYRVIMTRKSQQGLNYRYFWEQGVYGINRYWLNRDPNQEKDNFRLRNFTRSLTLTGNPIPERLRIDYELWSGKLELGHYVLHLDIN